MINLRLNFHEWKSISNQWLTIKGRVPNANVGGLRYGKLSIRMVECKGLALVTLLELTNDQDS